MSRLCYGCIIGIVCAFWNNSAPVNGSNILIVPLSGEGSHYHLATAVGEAMVTRGHNVTILLSDIFEGSSTIISNQESGFSYQYYQSHITLEQFHDFMESFTRAGLKGEYMSFVMSNMSWHTEAIAKECDLLLDNMTTEASSPLRNANFSLAVTDFALPCPIAQRLDIPYVLLSPILAIPSAYLLANRNVMNPSYMPEMLTAYDHRMSFKERLLNTISTAMWTLLTHIVVQPRNQHLRARYDLRGEVSLMFTDAEMWLINSHIALDFPRPLLPNTKFVGGLTTKPAKSLSQVGTHTYLYILIFHVSRLGV